MRPVYLDTNVLVQLIERQDPILRAFLAQLNRAGKRLVTSEITLAELLVKPLQSKNTELTATYEALLSPDGLVQTHPVDLAVLRRSAEVRAEFGGNLPDSVHVATAERSGCETILSSDQRLKLPPGLSRVDVNDLQP